MTTIRITKADRDQAKELGVQASAVATLRAKHGRENVAAKLGLGVLPAPESDPVPVLVAPVPGFVNLKVLRRCLNPIWVTCQESGVAVNVRVRRNNRLRPGMLLQCRKEGNDWKCCHAGFAPV